MCQRDMILQHLREHGSITSIEAVERYGILRLGSRVYDLRKAGHRIVGIRARGVNRFSQPVSFMRYVLADGAPEVNA